MEKPDTRPIWFLNRSILVVRGLEPFATWLASLDDANAAVDPTVDGVNAFLIPEFELFDESWAWVREQCTTIFELMLHEWYTDDAVWPKDRSWEAFQEWFDCELIDLAWDLVEGPLSSDPPEIDQEPTEWDA